MAKMGDVSNLKGLSEDEQTKKLLDLMDEPTVIIIKDLVLATLKESYPEQKEGILKKFTAQHFMELFPVIIELNTKTMNTEPNDKGTIQQVKR